MKIREFSRAHQDIKRRYLAQTNEDASVEKHFGQHDRSERRHEPERALPVMLTLETMLRLQEQQNDLNIQQNEIMKGLSLQQQKSTLPQQRVPVFEGNPMEYNNFNML